ncbi:type VII secretion-associated serine protease mycosin [Mycolicibacterium sp. D5.8-2]|uniref:type VII secretion-associated serine protease mycosin n=1 Tax=Mycolicibacterium sp. D5.8-2 TaxID=3085903 RepID=UPI00298C3608|nr:type VII secretion-associated serine protease mycosin [Mycolicibacterium sp. D5.8-2]MDW5612538.1 type VII secretion-associated serine protease mycosin [Mycolicibacterium sp. D5.8-2]
MRAHPWALAAAVALLAASALPAGAITPPEVDPAVPPPGGSAGPVGAMAQRNPCVISTALPGTDPGAATPDRTALRLSEAWTHSRGEGQTVAVLDTGVKPGPRLPDVEAGGDYVASGDGLTDCDGQGTLVAGLIAGQPGADGFSGVAPAARILSIRVSSPRYAPRDAGEDPAVTRAMLETEAMAGAIVRAADLGARVINISAVTCVPVGENFDQSGLGAALRYAAVDRDVVIVAAAGEGGAAGGCDSNPLSDPALPSDPRNWSGVTAVAIPAWWQQYVLSVGSLAPDGTPSSFTMAGPWVGIAAPGEDITSVSNDEAGGLANGLPGDRDRIDPVRGTGYATAYVSGVAALVRSRFPDLTARQVIERLTGTAQSAARSPSNLVGAGRIDPVAALTWNVPATEEIGTTAARPVAAPAPPPPKDPVPRAVAFAGAGVLALVVLTVSLMSTRRKETSS